MTQESTSLIAQNVSLDKLNTFAVSATARAFVEITSLSQLERVKKEIAEFDNRLVLGSGSNVLFVNNYSGLIIYPQLKGIEILQESDNEVTISVAASENWHEFVDYCVTSGYYGLENLALIPGTVGAAPVQNIGAYGVEIERFIKTVYCSDLSTGESLIFAHEDCEFSYRDSLFKQAGQGHYLVTSVEFVLSKTPDCVLSYKPLKDHFETKKEKATPRQVFDRVCIIRQSKLPDPTELANAGSFFKNPIIDEQQYVRLVQEFPDIVVYPLITEHKRSYKVAAGWLIERAGFKGKTYDRIGVYSKQALVLVNYTDDKGSNILALAQEIMLRIKQMFQLDLEVEVRIIE